MADLRKQRRRYGVLLLLLCPIAAFVLMPHPPDMSVQKRARKLVDVNDWLSPHLAGALAYQWQSPTSVLVMHSQGELRLIDTTNGIERAPTKMMSVIRSRPGLSPFIDRLPVWMLSPDGKWLVAGAMNHGRPEWIAVTVDGSRLVEIPTPELHDAMVFWDHDSRSFAQIFAVGGKIYARRFTMDGPNASASIPIGDDRRDLHLDIPPYRFDNPYMPLGEFAQDYLLMTNFGGRGQPRCLIFNLKSPLKPVRAEIDVPTGAFVSEMELAPDGKHIGWIFDFAVGVTDPFLRRLPFMPVGPGHGNHEVWVSNLDGSHMHPIATPGVDRDTAGPGNLRWTPDSKNVTFIYNGALYTAPAR